MHSVNLTFDEALKKSRSLSNQAARIHAVLNQASVCRSGQAGRDLLEHVNLHSSRAGGAMVAYPSSIGKVLGSTPSQSILFLVSTGS
jgi:hypothetical protein